MRTTAPPRGFAARHRRSRTRRAGSMERRSRTRNRKRPRPPMKLIADDKVKYWSALPPRRRSSPRPRSPPSMVPVLALGRATSAKVHGGKRRCSPTSSAQLLHRSSRATMLRRRLPSSMWTPARLLEPRRWLPRKIRGRGRRGITEAFLQKDQDFKATLTKLIIANVDIPSSRLL